MNILETWKNWSKKLKLQTYTLYYAYKDPMTPWYAKMWGAVVVAYAFSPIDLIPDFVPIVGYLDDLILIPLGISLAVKLIPKEILIKCRQQAQERIDSKRPVNWIAGGIIIAIWIMMFYAVVYIILKRMLK